MALSTPISKKSGHKSGMRPVLNAEAKEYLKTTYLKPLRDAKADLIPRKSSRLSQILQGHDAFRGKEKTHHLVKQFEIFNKTIEKYFEGKNADDTAIIDDLKGKALKDEIDSYVKAFWGALKQTEIDVAEGSLKSILEKLELSIKDDINPGLGTLNRLFMASELLHLHKKDWSGLRLGLIEELEAHLHPQAQMQIIESLQSQQEVQLVLTTHSPNLASKVNLANLIICNSKQAFPLGKEFTKLNPADYTFLEWFLDVTKANLFFAKGVILVEGWAEEILIPALAKKMKKDGIISKDLTEAGVSIVNVGSTALLNYSKIFIRKTAPFMTIPVAIITDVDVRPFVLQEALDEKGAITKDAKGKTIYNCIKMENAAVSVETGEKTRKLESEYNEQNIRSFIAPCWTLEYGLYNSSCLGIPFKEVIKKVHPQIDLANMEEGLARKLIKKSFNKTRTACLLAQSLLDDCNKTTPQIVLNNEDTAIKYLIEAIKYACNN